MSESTLTLVPEPPDDETYDAAVSAELARRKAARKAAKQAKKLAKQQKQLEIEPLLDSWMLSLRAQKRSPSTLRSYREGVTMYLAWCAEHGLPGIIDRAQLTRFVDYTLSERKLSAATATARQVAVRQYAAWLVDEGELGVDPLLGMRRPKIDEKVIEPLSKEQIQALIKACAGPTLRDKRDEALIRLMCETGARATEAATMLLADTNLLEGVAIIRRGKGGKGRRVSFSPFTARAIDRYLRLRRSHGRAGSPNLWLGQRGTGFGYNALHSSLALRAEAAGIAGFHPHRMRHTAAHNWLAAGGSEGSLMAQAGWSKHDMLDRYTKASREERAIAEAKTLNLGDF